MLRYLKSPSIHQTTLIVIILAGFFAIMSAFIVIYNEFREAEKQIESAKEQYIKSQKESLVLHSSKLFHLISFLYSNQDEKLFISNAIELSKTLFEDSKNFTFIFDKKSGFIQAPKFDDKGLINQLANELKIIDQDGIFQRLSHNESEIIFYIRQVKDLNWVVGSGAYLDELQEVVKSKKEESQKRVGGFILKIATLTLFLYAFGILKYRYLTKQISKDIKHLDNAFKKAPLSYEFVDEGKITFVEFKEISSHANKMIAKIREKNQDLMRLNANLEKIIEEKTGALKRSNEYTKELLKQQDKFVNNAIHEINTPLTIIMMNIELYNLKLPKTTYLTKIEAAAKVLENIYEDLGYVIKKNRTPYPKTRINMSNFLLERIAYFNDVAEGNGVYFKSEIEPDIWIYFSLVELQRIVDNNISNAIKYAVENSAVELFLHVKDKRIYFEVSNMGKPIKKPEKLFERYYREDQVRGGFGLGLNIVKEICDTNGIKIEVTSKEGRTSFKYTFNQGVEA